MKTVPFSEFSKAWWDDPAFREAYDAAGPAMALAFAMAEARHHAKLTQAELAARMGTSQSAVNRWERGRAQPSTQTLLRFAEVTGTRLRVVFDPVEA
jgi:HTH-type transcriptional regulator/antitoxin HipB